MTPAHDVNPEVVDALESMLIDGTGERQDVADYLPTAFGFEPLHV